MPQTETGVFESVRYVGELVEEGWSILIFPEGERTWTGAIGRFYPGVGMLAFRTLSERTPSKSDLVGRYIEERNLIRKLQNRWRTRCAACETAEGKSDCSECFREISV